MLHSQLPNIRRTNTHNTQNLQHRPILHTTPTMPNNNQSQPTNLNSSNSPTQQSSLHLNTQSRQQQNPKKSHQRRVDQNSNPPVPGHTGVNARRQQAFTRSAVAQTSTRSITVTLEVSDQTTQHTNDTTTEVPDAATDPEVADAITVKVAEASVPSPADTYHVTAPIAAPVEAPAGTPIGTADATSRQVVQQAYQHSPPATHDEPVSHIHSDASDTVIFAAPETTVVVSDPDVP